jgi:hypothetical protein
MSLPEEINILHSSMRPSRIGRVPDDRVQVGDDMVFEHSIEIIDCASERIGGETIDVAVVGEGSELAWFVLGVEKGCGSLGCEVSGAEAESDVEEAVDGDDVGVPLVDGVLHVALRGGGCGVEDAGEVLAGQERARCGGGGEREGCEEGLHDWVVGLGIGVGLMGSETLNCC